MRLQLQGVLLLLIASLSGRTVVEKAGQRMRNVEKRVAEMAAKVEEARKALPSTEEKRVANEKALVEARRHFHKTQQEHFARFPSCCPVDNDAFVVQARCPQQQQAAKAPAATCQRAGPMAVYLPDDGDQETRDLWQQHRDLAKIIQQIGSLSCEPPKWRSICKQQRQKPQWRQVVRRASDQIVADEESPSSEQEPDCLSFKFANITC